MRWKHFTTFGMAGVAGLLVATLTLATAAVAQEEPFIGQPGDVGSFEAADWNSGEYYGLAMPQLYGEVGNQDLSVKLGHFYTIVGYEGVAAVGNFFYIKSYSYMAARHSGQASTSISTGLRATPGNGVPDSSGFKTPTAPALA